MTAESPAEGGARPRSPWAIVALVATGLVGLTVAPMAPELSRSWCAYSIEAEADRAADFGEQPGNPGASCEVADFLKSIEHRVGSLLGRAAQD